MRRWTAALVFAALVSWSARSEAIQIELGTYNFVEPEGDTLYGAGLLNDFYFGGPLSILYGFHLVLDKSHLVTDLNLGPLLQIGDGEGPAVRIGGTLLVVFVSGFDDNPGGIMAGGKGILGAAWVFETRRSVYLDLELQYGSVLDGFEGDEEARVGLNVWLGFAF